MFKLPQTQRLMKLVMILAALALFVTLIISAFVPEFFVVGLIAIVFMVGALALFLKIFEWICFGSDK